MNIEILTESKSGKKDVDENKVQSNNESTIVVGGQEITQQEIKIKDETDASAPNPILIAPDDSNIKHPVLSLILHICTLIGTSVFLIALFGTIISLIYFGAAYLDKCPAQPFLPIYSLVLGLLFMIWIIYTFITQACCTAYDENPSETRKWLHRIYKSFLLGWFTSGTIYAIRTYRPIFDPDWFYYCDEIFFYFIFGFTTIIIGIFIVIIVVMLVVCSFACFEYCFCKKNNDVIV